MTWKAELDMKRRYPHLFESIDNAYQGTNSLPGTLETMSKHVVTCFYLLSVELRLIS